MLGENPLKDVDSRVFTKMLRKDRRTDGRKEGRTDGRQHYVVKDRNLRGFFFSLINDSRIKRKLGTLENKHLYGMLYV